MSISYMTPTGPIPIPVSGGAISLETLKKIADIEKELFNLKQTIASDTMFGLSKITSASDVTLESGIALSAVQNNPNIEGSIAQKVAKNKEKIEQTDAKFANYYILSGGVEINPNEDLNSAKFFVPGNYYCGLNDNVQTLKNCPTTNAFTLKVEHSIGTSYPAQTLRDFYNGEIFYRFKAGGGIHNWYKLTPTAV